MWKRNTILLLTKLEQAIKPAIILLGKNLNLNAIFTHKYLVLKKCGCPQPAYEPSTIQTAILDGATMTPDFLASTVEQHQFLFVQSYS